MPRILSLFFVIATAIAARGQSPDIETVFKGQVLRFTFDQSKIFPGTTGRLWVATRMGLQFCDQAGRVNGIIPTPNGKVANLTFGGPEFDTIYACCGDQVYSRKVKVKGAKAPSRSHSQRPPNWCAR
jgi:hypothetical protein